MAWFLVFTSVALQLTIAQIPMQIPPVVVADGGLSVNLNICPPQVDLDTVIENLTSTATNILQSIFAVPKCGPGLWYRVAFLNMSDPTQQCPSAWREYTSNEIRTCARPNSTKGSCPHTIYPVNRQYNKVCGRVIGYQLGSPAAFRSDAHKESLVPVSNIYLDGISITLGINYTHVWSYAAGSSTLTDCPNANCPCSGGRDPPQYVGNNYFCESAYLGPFCWVTNRFFPDDPLWDGQQCDNEMTCCTGTDNITPPWFKVELSEHTRDYIEVRICHDQGTKDEDTPVQLLEIYIQ